MTHGKKMTNLHSLHKNRALTTQLQLRCQGTLWLKNRDCFQDLCTAFLILGGQYIIHIYTHNVGVCPHIRQSFHTRQLYTAWFRPLSVFKISVFPHGFERKTRGLKEVLDLQRYFLYLIFTSDWRWFVLACLQHASLLWSTSRKLSLPRKPSQMMPGLGMRREWQSLTIEGTPKDAMLID
jgi:hypothetical protein